MILDIIYILSGLTLLFFGGDKLVDGAVAIARKAHISKAVIGLTIVAFGTSAPEFVVNIHAMLANLDSVAIGNVIGSNISNGLFILGISGMFATINLKNRQIRQDILFLTLITLIFLGFCYHQQKVGIIDGFIYLILMAAYSFRKYDWVKNNKQKEDEFDIEGDLKSLKALAYVVAGIAMLILGGDLTVTGAISIAKSLGISEAIISVTIIAFGSSAPELATCISACKKGHDDIALSNIIGSNIFNIVLGLGAISVFQEIFIANKFIEIDLPFLMASVCILIFAMIFYKKIPRTLAVLLILLYIAFLGLQYINS